MLVNRPWIWKASLFVWLAFLPLLSVGSGYMGLVNSNGLNFTQGGTPNISCPTDMLCIYLSSAPFDLVQDDYVGLFTGNGVVGNRFFPSEAGIGEHSVTFTSANGTCWFTIVVSPDFRTGTHNTNPIEACPGYNPPALTIVGANGKLPLMYEWIFGGMEVGDNVNVYDHPQIAVDGTFAVYAKVTDACGTSGNTLPKVYTIHPEPEIVILGDEVTCLNQPIDLQTLVQGGAGNFENYQWFRGTTSNGPWMPIDGATTATYKPSTDVTGSYYYRVTLNPNVASCNQTSANTMLEVAPDAYAQISGGGRICSGNSVDISFEMEGEPPWSLVVSDGESVYQLDSIFENFYEWTPIPVKSSEFRLISAADSRCPSARLSGSASVVVVDPPIVSISAPEQVCRTEAQVSVVFTNHTGYVVEMKYRLNGAVQSTLILLSGSSHELTFSTVGIDLMHWEFLSASPLGETNCVFPLEGGTTTQIADKAVSGSLLGAKEICYGDWLPELYLAGHTGIVKWQYSLNALQWYAIEGVSEANLPTYILGPLYQTTWVRAMVSSGPCEPVATDAVIINVRPPLPDIVMQLNQPGCLELAGGMAVVSPVGPEFSYSLNGIDYSSISDFYGLPPGNHSLYVQNKTGCVVSVNFDIDATPDVPAKPELVIKKPDCQFSDGVIEVVFPRSVDLLYSLDGTKFQSAPKFEGLSAGVYSVVVKNLYGCVSVEWVVIDALYGAPDIPKTEVILPICSHPFGTLQIVDPFAEYSYSIQGGPFEPYPPNGYENLSVGTYLLSVKNSEGCVSSKIIDVPEPEDISLWAEVLPESCYGAANGAIDVHLLTGQDLQFKWSGPEHFSATSASISGLSAGSYHLEVSNSGGCFLSANYIVHGPLAPLAIEVEMVHPELCDPSDGAMAALLSGGVAPYSFRWTNSNGEMVSNESRADGLRAGHYVLEISDAVGCTIQENFILDFAAPADCRNYSALVDGFGKYEVVGRDLLLTAYDDCNLYEHFAILVDPPVLYCSEYMVEHAVNIQLISRLGTVYQCTALIELRDTLPPVAACRDTVLFLDEKGMAYLETPSLDRAGHDNCGLATSRLSRNHFACGDVGIHSVSLMITDVYGNFSSCTFWVTVADTLPPRLVAKDVELWFTTSDTLWLADALWEHLIFENCFVQSDTLSKHFFTCSDLGEHSITRNLTDGSGNSVQAEFRVVVRSGTQPVTESDTFMVVSGTPSSLDIMYNDQGHAGAFVQLVESPRYGSAFFDTGTGSLTYRSNADFVGTDSLRYALCSDGGICGPICDTALVIIYVMPYNFPPVASNDRFELGNCHQIGENVLHNDLDPGSDIWLGEVTLLKAPSYGTLQIFSDGQFFYQPEGNFVGVDNFVYQVCDTGFPVLCDSAYVQLHILADTNCDGIPDAYTIGLFVPEGFSPNGDGIGDQFRILGLEDYPNARLRVYDRWGRIVFDRRSYGNLSVWATEDAAWWRGTYEGRYAQDTLVPRGNYMYLLELGNGTSRRGMVTVAY